MTHIEQAIREAVQKGQYGGDGTTGSLRLIAFANQDPNQLALYQYEELYGNPEKKFLDQLFWQSLGKARGWDEEQQKSGWSPTVYWEPYDCGWKYNWHEFIDHLAAEKDAESFFASL